MRRRTRFAPSPTGPLHLGHAYAALIAAERGDEFLLRIEDIDRARCTLAFEQQIYADLHWLGLRWNTPVMRQSDRLPAYRAALDRLAGMGVLYTCTCTRGDIRAALSAPQEGVMGPDGLIYPGTCRGRIVTDDGVLRLDIARALELAGRVEFNENGPLRGGVHALSADWMVPYVGDVVLARRDMGTSYHLSVVVDDAAQGVSEVTRGVDLFDATCIHVLLQTLLEFPVPSYWHHDLIRDDQGKRLAKRDDARALSLYRAQGATPADIRALVNL